MSKKTAVILFNLGGPDSLKAVRPFLFNLFSDKAIIRLPYLPRKLLASVISLKRAGQAKGIYAEMGGKSPIFEETQKQVEALESLLRESGDFKVFMSMRYWKPMSRTVARIVKSWAPDHVVLLPLYPQFSTTTTASSFEDWHKSAKAAGLDAPTSAVCCYPDDFYFSASYANLIRETYWKAAEKGKPRILFSAHGLPEKIVEDGDPYPRHVERSVTAITRILAIEDLDYQICYQSRVGPLKWIGPATDEEIIRASRDDVPMVVVPVAFVSEHSETLVELDIEYKHLAQKHGAKAYFRVPAVGSDTSFIQGLAQMVLRASGCEGVIRGGELSPCGAACKTCPCTLGVGPTCDVKMAA